MHSLDESTGEGDEGDVDSGDESDDEEGGAVKPLYSMDPEEDAQGMIRASRAGSNAQ